MNELGVFPDNSPHILNNVVVVVGSVAGILTVGSLPPQYKMVIAEKENKSWV